MKIRNGPEGGVTGILENQTAYNIIENEEDDSAEITMYGEVVKDRPWSFRTDEKDERLYIVLSEFLNDLEKVKNRSKLTIRINSPGGDLYAGLAIMNRLSELKGDVITIVDGLAASAASIILQGGKKRKVHNGSMVMIHGASTFLFGNYNAAKLEEAVKQLDAANRAAAEAYAQRTGIDKNEIDSIMAKTDWMTGQEAIDKKFADELIDTGNVSMSISADNAYLSVNGIVMPTLGFETLPAGLTTDYNMVIPGSRPEFTDKNENKGGNGKLTAEEMKAKYPDVVAEIEKNAVAAKGEETQKEAIKSAVEEERKRISEIDEIANLVGDKELLKKAKFEKPMTAAELALEAMRQQAKLGAQFMRDSQDDVKNSGVEDVVPTPSGDMQDELEQNDITAGALLLAGVQKGEKE